MNILTNSFKDRTVLKRLDQDPVLKHLDQDQSYEMLLCHRFLYFVAVLFIVLKC